MQRSVERNDGSKREEHQRLERRQRNGRLLAIAAPAHVTSVNRDRERDELQPNHRRCRTPVSSPIGMIDRIEDDRAAPLVVGNDA